MKSLIVFVLLLGATSANAQETVAISTTSPGGHVWDGSYWVLNGANYTRSWVNGYYYYQNGCRYWSPGYYQYAAVTVVNKAATNPNDWRAQLLKIKQEQVEHQNYLDSIRFLGLEHRTSLQLNYGSLQIGNYGVSGSTIYGESLATLAHLYGANSLGVDFQSYNRGLEAVGSLHEKTLAGLGQLLTVEGANRARIAEIIAKGQAAERALQALNGPAQRTEIKQEFRFRIGADGKPEVINDEPKQTASGGDVFKAWNAQANQCAACHFGARENLKGGFDISTWPGLPVAKKLEYAQKHLLTKDPAKIMPRTESGPGTPLPEKDVMDLWLRVTANKQ